VIDCLIDCGVDFLLGHTLGSLCGLIDPLKQPAESLFPSLVRGTFADDVSLRGPQYERFVFFEGLAEQSFSREPQIMRRSLVLWMAIFCMKPPVKRITSL